LQPLHSILPSLSSSSSSTSLSSADKASSLPLPVDLTMIGPDVMPPSYQNQASSLTTSLSPPLDTSSIDTQAVSVSTSIDSSSPSSTATIESSTLLSSSSSSSSSSLPVGIDHGELTRIPIILEDNDDDVDDDVTVNRVEPSSVVVNIDYDRSIIDRDSIVTANSLSDQHCSSIDNRNSNNTDSVNNNSSSSSSNSSSSRSSRSKSKRSKDDTSSSSSIVITSKIKNEKKIIIKSCYELEKEILNCKNDMNLIGQMLSNITIKSIQSIFNSLLEPSVLYLFLKVIYQYYGILKVNYIKVLNYYRVVGGLSSFQLQYNLLDSNERSELYEYVQEIKAKVIVASCDSSRSSINDCSTSNSGDCGTNVDKDKNENMIKMSEIEKLFIF
jgi:hypothetical protein